MATLNSNLGPERLGKIAARCMAQGPDRVIIDAEGRAVPAWKAIQDGIVWDKVLVRDDGWTLGTSYELLNAARATWEGHWDCELGLSNRAIGKFKFVEATDRHSA